jgi:DNA modification methylase
MADDGKYPYSASEREVKLSWKTRRIKSNHPGGGEDHGSYYAILPKEQVRQLGWEPPRLLVTRIAGDELVIRTAPRSKKAERPVEHMPRAPLDRIIQGDVLEVLRGIPDSSVHLAITSPPYNVGINYQEYRDDLAYSEYRRWLQEVWKEVYRVLVRGGRFALETAPTSIANFVPIHVDLTNDARSIGFTFRAEIVWYKQNMTAPRTAWGSFRSPGHPHLIPSWEYVNVLHKQDWKLAGSREDIDILSEEFVDWSDAMWKISPDSRAPGDHPAAFPGELVRRLMRFYSFRGQTILDPFGGTGTVAAEAKRTGRHFIHVDHSQAYCDVAEARVGEIRFGEDGRGREPPSSAIEVPKGSRKSRARSG